MNKNVPKLRFKEFDDEWKKEKLGNLFEFKNGVNADKEAYGKGIKFINVLDILNNNYIDYNNIVGLVDIDEKTLDKYAVNYGDILFQRSSETREEVGTANVYLGDKTVTFGGFVIRGKKIAKYDPRFMNSLLKSSSSRKEIVTKAGGSTRYNVGQEILSDVNTNLPSLQEQEKIADFFTILDSLIEEQDGKVSDLELYKKGMMQKIFSQEVRFKDENGCDYPKWEEKKLNEILTETKAKNTGDLKVCSVAVRKGVVDQIEHLGRSFAAKDTSNYKLVQKGNLIYTKSPTGQFPYGIVKQSFINENVIVSPLYGVFEPINYFLGYLLHSYFYYKENMNNYLYSLVQKGAKNTMNISNEIFLSKKIKLPVNLKEQEKIAGFLSDIDRLIKEEQKSLDDLRKMKKGLLQQMFV